MTKTPYQNEQIKRDFFEHLRGAEGFSESSIKTCAEAISQWETFSKHDDFYNFSKSKAIEFREYLDGRKIKTGLGKLALSTQDGYLRRVRKFFKWLSDQPGYKNKVLKNEVGWLRLSKTDARVARSGTTRQIPTFEEVKKIIQNIDGDTEIDRRDRAMICFGLITGARISAIASLKMKSFDKKTCVINQNPKDGVKTKNSKQIFTTFFPIGWNEPEKYFMEWYESLEAKGFQPDDPIFPSTSNFFANKNSYSKELVSKTSWSGSGAARKIFEKRCLNAGVPYFHPHSLRHLVVNIVSKIRLTEEEKKAISLNLGHENVGTTFGSYGYGHMTSEEAIKTVKSLQNLQNDLRPNSLTEEEIAIIRNIGKRNE